ncbi:hypothetical protein TanjilG_02196 [Lupinus angustifolius]|uniref:DYW domain-containing protein n=1 Tax=Lupinus angustifolius TaxID=3871 RepID=A0A1J7ICW4_LUPAN|nr:hypothetical protein TanjilG_02196 [Lupinus angustifolius]
MIFSSFSTSILDSLFHCCKSIHLTKSLHALLFVLGKSQNVVLSTKLLNLYASFGYLSLSHSTFQHLHNKNIYSWNSIIAAYVHSARYTQALNFVTDLFSLSSQRPDFYTFPPTLKACQCLIDGRKMHCCILKMGFENDVFVGASLINLYSRFRGLDSAYKVFVEMPVRDVGSWNAMISGFCQNGNAAEALDVLNKMKGEGLKMDKVTVSSILPVCAQSNDVVSGLLIHLYVIKHGLEEDVFVSNALINMYSKFGRLQDSQRVFDYMKVKDLVSWNSIIAAYEQNNDPTTALGLFKEMQLIGIRPDLLTVVSLASILGQLNDQMVSRSVHGFVMRHEWLEKDVVIGNALVNMYAKLGAMDCASTVFEHLPLRDIISWNTLITGYAQNGLASEAIDAFNKMEQCENIIPNQGTWVSILPAYSHLGALQKGTKIHGRLIKNSLYLDVFVATSLIDMYGKSSHRLLEADSDNVGYYVLLSNMYANVGKWEGVTKVRSLARDRGLSKTPGWSSVVVGSIVEVFYTGNQTHPKCIEIYDELSVLTAKMKSLGYVPDYSFVLQDVEEDEKEQILTSHSERLAIAFGIISTPHRSSIRIFKNLRVCGDCHSATKYISRITERDIVVRDSNRFHHFKDGICSCGDYW